MKSGYIQQIISKINKFVLIFKVIDKVIEIFCLYLYLWKLKIIRSEDILLA